MFFYMIEEFKGKDFCEIFVTSNLAVAFLAIYDCADELDLNMDRYLTVMEV